MLQLGDLDDHDPYKAALDDDQVTLEFQMYRSNVVLPFDATRVARLHRKHDWWLHAEC